MVRRVAIGKRGSSAKVSKKSLSPAELHEKVKKKAYEIYEKRGGTHGNDWADWFEAEKTIKSD